MNTDPISFSKLKIGIICVVPNDSDRNVGDNAVFLHYNGFTKMPERASAACEKESGR